MKTVRALRRNFDDVIRHVGIGASDLIEDRVERDFGIFRNAVLAGFDQPLRLAKNRDVDEYDVLLFWCSMPLTDDERYHLDHCAYCQSVVAEYKKYIDPAMIPAACNLGDREQLRHQAMERRQFARSPAETAHPMPIPSTL